MAGERENYTNLLIEFGELSTNELFKKSFTVSKRQFMDKLEELKEQGFIGERKDGNKIMLSVDFPDIQTSVFIKDFGRRIERYDIDLKKLFEALEKSLPMIDPDMPMKSVKVKQRAWVMDKKDKNIYKRTGKLELNDDARTWNTRKRPLNHLENILRLLNNLQQDTTILTFDTDIISESKLLNKYQAKAKKIIDKNIRKLEDMFQGTIDWAFVVWKIRAELHATIYRKTIELAMSEAERISKKN